MDQLVPILWNEIEKRFFAAFVLALKKNIVLFGCKKVSDALEDVAILTDDESIKFSCPSPDLNLRCFFQFLFTMRQKIANSFGIFDVQNPVSKYGTKVVSDFFKKWRWSLVIRDGDNFRLNGIPVRVKYSGWSKRFHLIGDIRRIPEMVRPFLRFVPTYTNEAKTKVHVVLF